MVVANLVVVHFKEQLAHYSVGLEMEIDSREVSDKVNEKRNLVENSEDEVVSYFIKGYRVVTKLT